MIPVDFKERMKSYLGEKEFKKRKVRENQQKFITAYDIYNTIGDITP